MKAWFLRQSLFLSVVFASGQVLGVQAASKCQDLKVFHSTNLSSCKFTGLSSCKYFRTDSLKIAEASGEHSRHRFLILSEKKSCSIIGVTLDSNNLKIFNELRRKTESISMPVMASALVNELFGIFQIEDLKTTLSYKVEGSWPGKVGFTVLYFVVDPWANLKEEIPTNFGCIDVDARGAMEFSPKAKCLDVFLASQKEMVGRYFSTD